MSTPTTTTLPHQEQHYTPAQLAKRWGLSSTFVRDLFRNEPGVIAVDRPEKMHKRSYTSLRIPESVALRVHTELSPAKRKPRSADQGSCSAVRKTA